MVKQSNCGTVNTASPLGFIFFNYIKGFSHCHVVTHCLHSFQLNKSSRMEVVLKAEIDPRSSFIHQTEREREREQNLCMLTWAATTSWSYFCFEHSFLSDVLSYSQKSWFKTPTQRREKDITDKISDFVMLKKRLMSVVQDGSLKKRMHTLKPGCTWAKKNINLEYIWD